MDKNSKMQQLDNSIDEQLKSAFGYSDEQLLAEFEAAEKELKEHPELLKELKAPVDEFEKILDCVKEYETSETAETVKTNAKPKRSFRSRKVWKMLVAAALVGVLVLSSALVVCGKRAYKYWRREDGRAGRVIWNNTDENLVKLSKVEDAYKLIEDELEVLVITLDFLPYEMQFIDISLFQNSATLNFVCDDKYIHMIEAENSAENSSGMYTDTDSYMSVYNAWLDREIYVRKNLLDNGTVEYTAEFGIDSTYYNLSANVSQDVFVEILKGLKKYKGV